MLWWWTPQENAFAQATPLLTSLTGTYGERFVWSLVGTRSTQSGRAEPRNYLLKMPPKDVVIVSNKVPLSIGMDGAALFVDKFKLLRGDVDVGIDGIDFYVGENLLVRLGKVKLRQIILGEFCEIRWVAMGSSAPSGAYGELVAKLGLPTARRALDVDLKSVANVPFDSRHTALQMVKLYEDAMAARGYE